jgi:hypothetical protein
VEQLDFLIFLSAQQAFLHLPDLQEYFLVPHLDTLAEQQDFFKTLLLPQADLQESFLELHLYLLYLPCFLIFLSAQHGFVHLPDLQEYFLVPHLEILEGEQEFFTMLLQAQADLQDSFFELQLYLLYFPYLPCFLAFQHFLNFLSAQHDFAHLPDLQQDFLVSHLATLEGQQDFFTASLH